MHFQSLNNYLRNKDIIYKKGIVRLLYVEDSKEIIWGGKFRCNHAPYGLKEMQEPRRLSNNFFHL